jgi:hypothetical protein
MKSTVPTFVIAETHEGNRLHICAFEIQREAEP